MIAAVVVVDLVEAAVASVVVDTIVMEAADTIATVDMVVISI